MDVENHRRARNNGNIAHRKLGKSLGEHLHCIFAGSKRLDFKNSIAIRGRATGSAFRGKNNNRGADHSSAGRVGHLTARTADRNLRANPLRKISRSASKDTNFIGPSLNRKFIRSPQKTQTAKLSIAGRLSTTEAPWREDHVLSAFSRRSQNGLDSSEKRYDGERVLAIALSGDHHDGFALLQVRKSCDGHAGNHLLKIAAGAALGRRSLRVWLSLPRTRRLIFEASRKGFRELLGKLAHFRFCV